jgi:hypothetical protein
MYKNIEVLDKKKHAKIKFESVDTLEVAKSIGVVPIGVDEVFEMSCIAPVIISAGDVSEFVAFTGVSKEVNIYTSANKYMPKFLTTYPFLNIVVADENKNLNTVVSIDNNTQYVDKNKKNFILDKSGELTKQADEKIATIRALDRQRSVAKTIIKELKENDLLLQKDFRVKSNDEETVLLKEFYIVNREKLSQLPDATLALWAKKGWMGIIDAHTKSLNNFQKVLVN